MYFQENASETQPPNMYLHVSILDAFHFVFTEILKPIIGIQEHAAV